MICTKLHKNKNLKTGLVRFLRILNELLKPRFFKAIFIKKALPNEGWHEIFRHILAQRKTQLQAQRSKKDQAMIIRKHGHKNNQINININ